MKASRAQLAAIHIAKKDRGLDDDTYRDLLERETGQRSAADLDDRGARKVMLAFEKLGFEKPSKPRRPAGDRRPIVRKAQAMWIALHNLDEVPSGHDRALDAFGKRLTGKASLRFSTNGEVGKVVEALKAWTERLGVSTDTTNAYLDPVRALIAEQQRRLSADGARAVTPFLTDAASFYAAANALGSEIRRRQLGRRHLSPSQPQGAETCPPKQDPSAPTG